ADPDLIAATEQRQNRVVPMAADEVGQPHEVVMGREVEVVDDDEVEAVGRHAEDRCQVRVAAAVAHHDATYGRELRHLGQQPGLADAGRADYQASLSPAGGGEVEAH